MNWFVPEFANSNVESFAGNNEKLETRDCPLDSKNSRNFSRISFPVTSTLSFYRPTSATIPMSSPNARPIKGDIHTAIAMALLCTTAFAQQQSNYPPDIPEARVETYKFVDGTDLKFRIFEPEGHKASDKCPAIVFFFGGGWRNGTPGQFRNQANHLATRGMFAMSADYRVLNRQGVKPLKCVQDAKAAIRWVRANAAHLGIAAGVGSAGGHLASAITTLPSHDNPAGDQSISSKPNALALFNPVTVLARVPGKYEEAAE